MLRNGDKGALANMIILAIFMVALPCQHIYKSVPAQYICVLYNIEVLVTKRPENPPQKI